MSAAVTAAPNDNRSHRYPVSVKGVVVIDGRVVLLRNERGEWELPGGKLDPGETPEACVMREIEEELGLAARIGPILDSWVYRIGPGIEVLIVSYGCHLDAPADIRLSHEHKAVGLFGRAEIDALPMPDGYKATIGRWFDRLSAG